MDTRCTRIFHHSIRIWRHSELSLVSQDSIKTICKSIIYGASAILDANGNEVHEARAPVAVAHSQEFKLYGMHHWVTKKMCPGSIVTPAEFTAAIGNLYALNVQEAMEDDADTTSKDLVKAPKPFTKDTNRVQWHQLLKNYLGTKNGCN